MVPDAVLYGVSSMVALLFASTFLFGYKLRPAIATAYDHRSVMSFAAGTSVAYVFVQLMPEMHENRTAFVDAIGMPLPYDGIAIYFVALLGFLGYYGLDHLRVRVHAAGDAGREQASFRLHVGGFAVYVWLMSYLLVHNLAPTGLALILSALASAIHFSTIDYSLRNEHGAHYDHLGRYLLAATSLLGWVTGLMFDMPDHVLALLLSFVSGAIIVNSSIMELPPDKDGRFAPFLTGGVFYGVLLVLLG